MNVVGLAIGIACTLLIALYIQDERGYDSFHVDADRIFRVASKGRLQGTEFNTAETGPLLAPAIQKQMPMVEAVVRLANWPTFPVRTNMEGFTEKYLLLADSNFFSFFSFKLLVGSANDVLRGDGRLVVSESAAKRLFKVSPDQYPLLVGREVTLAQGFKAKISGVAEDAPHGSHFHYSLVLSFASWKGVEENGFVIGKVKTYIKTKQQLSVDTLNHNLHGFVRNEIAEELKRRYDISKESFAKLGNYVHLYCQPITSIHLYSNLNDEIEINSQANYVYLFGFVALFITIIACINFVNLSTARSASRAKEVGIRKTVGAFNRKLVFQFLFESYLYTFAAVAMAFLLVVLCMVPFKIITEKPLLITDLLEPNVFWVILLYVFFIGLLAGAYPAFFLTYLSPSQILRGSLRSGVTSHRVRNILVGVQFVISFALIIATLVINDQLIFLQRQQPGFQASGVLNMLHVINLGEQADFFKQELLRVPGVKSASYANKLPPHVDDEVLILNGDVRKQFLVGLYEMDAAHLVTMGYTMASGRFFEGDTSDYRSVIINETAARGLGITSPDGRPIQIFLQPNVVSTFKLIGIVKDFHFRSANHPIEPLVILRSRSPNLELAIRLSTQNTEQTLIDIANVWKKFSEGAPFEYSWVTQNFKRSYRQEARMREVLFLFSAIAMAIAAIGLLGLAVYTTQHRAKEIGIRKALGATRFQIITLMSKDFARLVLIAFFIAAPFTWCLMEIWLRQFHYRTEVSWQLILFCGMIATGITVATVSLQAWSAASAKPVKSLKME